MCLGSHFEEEMGGCLSNVPPEQAEQKRASDAIDRKLRVDLKDYENTIKILLLGSFFFIFMIFMIC